MASAQPKQYATLAGRPMLGHVLDTLSRLPLERVVVVVGPGMESVAAAVAPSVAARAGGVLYSGVNLAACKSSIQSSSCATSPRPVADSSSPDAAPFGSQ